MVPASSAYARAPALPGRQRIGGRAGRRRHDEAIGADVGHQVAADADAQLDHAGRGATGDHHIVERQRVVDLLAVAEHAAFEHRAVLFLEVAGQHRRQRLAELPGGDIGDEAEPALVDADQRHRMRRQFAGDAEHRAVAADHHRQVAALAELGGAQRRVAVGQAGSGGGLALHRDLEALLSDELRDLSDQRADALGLELADDRRMPEAL